MEEIIRVKKEDGVYDCDISITVEEWKEILQDKEIATEKILGILQLYYNEPNHASTSENLSQKFGGTRQSYFVPISGFCSDVQKKLNRFTIKGRKGENAYCVIALIGRYVDNRYFEQRLRPELVQAMEELGLVSSVLRDDFVESRDDVIQNIQTLYSYAKSDSLEEQEYGVQRYRSGKWYVIEKIDGMVYFAPSRFVGYKDNTIEKYMENQGNGNHTNHQLINKLKLYKPITETDLNSDHNELVVMLNSFLSEFRIEKNNVNFLVPASFEINHIDCYNEKVEEYSKYTKLLLANKNIVLTGAPGTGKSYLAKRIAEGITNEGGEVGFVQFHPSYDYTDFVEGLRAEEVGNGGVGFKLKDGVFKEFCKTAILEPWKKFVFIIDEINRGEISKIFGELFFSIDPGYRGKEGKVKTQYQNLHSNETDTIFDSELGRGWFYVPENVYIIGTMNDIDRSVESMDFAMRRRFTWVEIDAESRAEMLDEYDWAEEAKRRMMAINSEIDQVEGLGKAYHIGPAYFLKLESYSNNSSTMWGQLWDLHIEPLVKEYLRGMLSGQRVLENIKAAYDGYSFD